MYLISLLLETTTLFKHTMNLLIFGVIAQI